MWKPLLATLLLTATCAAAPATQPVATLVGFASLPADTFGDGPRSGQFITDPAPINGRTPPFDRQPIQGISSMLPTDTPDSPGEYLALSDNGYGTKANSADFLLSVYRVRPDFRTEAGGSGTVKIDLAFHLSDPDRKAGFPLVADAATYPNSQIPVPPEIKKNRLLTGGDFDPESMVRLPDGTFWIGDEYGPFLLHFSADGKLLEKPVGLPAEEMHSPDNPLADPKTAKIGRSAGFEGLAYDAPVPDAPLTLEAVLEKPLNEEAGLRIFHFLLDGGRPRVGEAPKQYPRFSEVWGTYPIAPSATAVGEFVCDSSTGIPRQYVAIERDDLQGPARDPQNACGGQRTSTNRRYVDLLGSR